MSDQTPTAASTNCSACSRENPPSARFCAGCGAPVGSTSHKRPYAAQPNESVASFALVSTVMPYASAQSAKTYKLAFLVGIAIPIIAVLLQQPTFALVTAAFVVPVVFIVYLYDVNLWEDAPVAVVMGAFVLSGVLAVGATLILRAWLATQPDASAPVVAQTFALMPYLILCVIAPIVGVVLMLIGPVVLASRPKFDDLMDGLTFGVVSGVAYACFETLTINWEIIAQGTGSGGDIAVWLPVIVNAALLKPVVFGCAVGIAAAEFSGLGEGYDGFTGRFFIRAIEAMVIMIAFASGLYLTGLLTGTTGVIAGMVWALVVAGLVIVRMRTVLQRALVEGALEAAARSGSSKWSSGPGDFCSDCEMPLLLDALFCVNCGESVRARSKDARHAHAAPDPAPAGEGGTS
jgi:predicted amidophosphoribosyltransferase